MSLLKTIITLTCILALGVDTSSQGLPPVCGLNPMMTPTCVEACIICDIDGFTGRNNSSIKGEAPPDFCTSFVHHMQWIGFVAGSTNLKIQITVSNCQRNEGLEVGLYQGIDCKNYKKISFCDTDIGPGEVAIFSNTTPLVIGQYYYVVMDGSDNDICDWTFKVLEGTTKLGVINDKAPFDAPDRGCVGSPIELKTPGLTGATDFLWRIDGNIIGSGLTVKPTIDSPGKHTICLTPRNVCQVGPENCREIEIYPNTVDTIIAKVCDKDCYTWFGKKLCTSGNYLNTIPNTNGCDSNIVLDLTVLETFDDSRTITMCTDDTLRIAEYILTVAGLYDLRLYNADSCEIILTLELKTVDCSIKAAITTDSLKCQNDNTGRIKLNVVNGVPPFKYKLEKLENESFVKEGIITSINTPIDINLLSAGNYFGFIMDNEGRETYVFATIYEPPTLNLNATKSIFNGYEVSCFGASDGSILFDASGGTKPYMFFDMLQNQVGEAITSLRSGNYDFIVADRNGCLDSIRVILTQPDSMLAKYNVKKLDCTGYNTADISLREVSGGVSPFTYEVRGKSTLLPIDSLTAGTYNLIATDANGCTFEDTLIIDRIEIPSLSVDSSEYQINLGESAKLIIIDSLTSASYIWSPIERVDCSVCLETEIMAVQNTTYTIVATSIDGCVDSINIRIKVDKKRSFIVSNVVSLASTSGNKDIKYFGGKDVESILLFVMYDRWGNKVYETTNLPNGVGNLDGLSSFNGKKISLGVYAWLAKVKYIDDVILIHKGDITIIE